MGTAQSRVNKYMTLTPEEQALVKQVWIEIENNPQFHGSIFFMGFCQIHPQYVKYFTTDSRLPLTFDARTNAKFTVIMETMGYLLLDFHDKPKQLDRIIGYVAMIHKDMNLEKSDMLNFGVSLLDYLTVTFPQAMTAECIEIISNYINNLLVELSQKMEEFKKNETLSSDEISGKSKIPCGTWIFCNDNLIYGQTLDYWKERKYRWDERLNQWKINESTVVQLGKNSSTEDEENSILKSKTGDETSEFAESTARLLESHGIPRTTKYSAQSHAKVKGLEDSSEKLTKRSLNRDKRYGNIVGEELHSEKVTSGPKTPREKRRSDLAEKLRDPVESEIVCIPENESKNSLRIGSDLSEMSKSQIALRIDSLARQRRRMTQFQNNPS